VQTHRSAILTNPQSVVDVESRKRGIGMVAAGRKPRGKADSPFANCAHRTKQHGEKPSCVVGLR